jgi:hypothetical protein
LAKGVAKYDKKALKELNEFKLTYASESESAPYTHEEWEEMLRHQH